MRRSRICLLHPFDPRGSKVGGLETYIRDFIGFHPPDVDVLLIGVDGRGDLTLGETHWATFRGRTFEFLPILHYPDDRAREAARSVRESITAQFFLSLLRRFGTVARAVRARGCSLDLRRVEYAWVPVMLGTPFIQMLHGRSSPNGCSRPIRAIATRSTRCGPGPTPTSSARSRCPTRARRFGSSSRAASTSSRTRR
jgi:hypothetical protein